MPLVRASAGAGAACAWCRSWSRRRTALLAFRLNLANHLAERCVGTYCLRPHGVGVPDYIQVVEQPRIPDVRLHYVAYAGQCVALCRANLDRYLSLLGIGECGVDLDSGILVVCGPWREHVLQGLKLMQRGGVAGHLCVGFSQWWGSPAGICFWGRWSCRSHVLNLWHAVRECIYGCTVLYCGR